MNRKLSFILKCDLDDSNYCIYGQYRKSRTVTLIPNGNNISCRLNTGESGLTKVGNRNYITTSLSDTPLCEPLNRYEVAVLGVVGSYRNINLDKISKSDVTNKIKEFLPEKNFSIYDLGEVRPGLYLVQVDNVNNLKGRLYSYSNGKITFLAGPCSLGLDAVVVSSKLYFHISTSDCKNSLAKEIFKVTESGIVKVFSQKDLER